MGMEVCSVLWSFIGRLAEKWGAERRGITDGTEDTDGEGGHLKVGLQDVGRGGLLTERGAGIV
jgi:hypothetical protein